jgi:choline kinase
MIYGIIPVGGIGSRLGMAFPKELLPLKGYNRYYPVSKLTVDNMLEAGCEKIYFIHGQEFKGQIKKYYEGGKYFHIKNYSMDFSMCIKAFLDNVELKESDKVLFGLPDSFYYGNLFLKLIKQEGLCCGLFETFDESKVDRINKNNKFDVKSQKNFDNLNLFWGVLKFDFKSLNDYSKILQETKEKEVGNIINKINFSYVIGEKYIDLGTWESLNKYWCSDEIYKS